jgi:GNAT superfamily N-acetyltransferase
VLIGVSRVFGVRRSPWSFVDTLEIRLLGPVDWREFRDVRLAALADAPYAFGSTLERERAFTETEWRDRLSRRAQFLATAGGRPVATAAGILTEQAGSAELVSMWVDPGWRGRGVGQLLVERVLKWAADQGSAQVLLWVTDGNLPAETLYLSLGFEHTGERQPVLPEDPARLESRMVLRLGAAAGPLPPRSQR